MDGNLDKEILYVIGNNLRHLRNNTKVIKNSKIKILTQTEMAKWLGITYQQYSKYELSLNKVNAVNLYKLSKFFGVDINTMYDKEFINSKFQKTIIKV